MAMTLGNAEARIQELERQVGRLRDFNQVLLEHLRKVQHYSGAGKGPGTLDALVRWLIDLSDATVQKFSSSGRL